MRHPLMTCGCAAQGTSRVNGEFQPCCVTHMCTTVSMEQVDLSGRKAKCAYCPAMRDSDLNLAFFEYRKDRSTDIFYCGCYGWE